MDFSSQVVLVTGASRGIGRAVARQFAEHGARVAVHYNSNREAAEETLRSLKGDGHLVVQADLADASAVEGMVATVIEAMGGLQVLVNNAAIYEDHAVAQVDYAAWNAAWMHTLQTNLMGAANATYCAARHMMKHGGGRIVNVSSRGAFRGEPDAPAYAASKAGLNAMGQSLARALGADNVFITTVAPGWVETDMAMAHLEGPKGDEIRAQSPLNRVATPDEVAYTVVFLASAGAAFLTGAVVDINGASYLRT
ncbi:MAG: SDR family oxidoreductase [Anaerolineae bacterium]|nr:SDR family oxidoreductase [Anaerolineae bacterium]MBN8617981.1 SDR family oxidoreductase [Anaerolineae bacterium]